MRRRSKTCDVAGRVAAKEQTPRGSRDDRLEVRPREAAGSGGCRRQAGRQGRLDIPRKLQQRRRKKQSEAEEGLYAKGASEAREGESG